MNRNEYFAQSLGCVVKTLEEAQAILRSTPPPDAPSSPEDYAKYGTREGRQEDSLRLEERLDRLERFISEVFSRSFPFFK